MAYLDIATYKTYFTGENLTPGTDAFISLLLDASSDAIDNHCHRTFTPATADTVREFWLTDYEDRHEDIEIGDATALTRVETYDGTTWTEITGCRLRRGDDLQLDRPYRYLVPPERQTWPVSARYPTVRATCRYGWLPNIPPLVRAATALQTRRWTTRMTAPTQLDDDVAGMLADYVLARIQ